MAWDGLSNTKFDWDQRLLVVHDQTGPYSITSSTRASSVGGTSMASAAHRPKCERPPGNAVKRAACQGEAWELDKQVTAPTFSSRIDVGMRPASAGRATPMPHTVLMARSIDAFGQ